MALFDDLSKKAAKLTEKTIEKSSELADVAKTRVSIKSAQADLDEKFIELGKLYYEIISNDNIFDEKTAAIVQEIDSINTRIKELEAILPNNKITTIFMIAIKPIKTSARSQIVLKLAWAPKKIIITVIILKINKAFLLSIINLKLLSA